MRRTVPLLASMVLGVLLVSGVALAANITCPTGENGLCEGTTGDDTLTGTGARDTIKGLAGIDTLYGRGFPDYLEGGGGNDTLRGEAGNDTFYGDTNDPFSVVGGNDLLLGGPRDDKLYGGPGNDRMSGGPGNDKVDGSSFAPRSNINTMHGDDGDDEVYGGYGELYGDGGDDSLRPNDGDSVVYGGSGNDTLRAGTYRERQGPTDVGYTYEMVGGPGEDSFSVSFINTQLEQPPDDITYDAVDGEHDTIICVTRKKETVRADPLDTFPERSSGGGWHYAREYCDSITIVE